MGILGQVEVGLLNEVTTRGISSLIKTRVGNSFITALCQRIGKAVAKIPGGCFDAITHVGDFALYSLQKQKESLHWVLVKQASKLETDPKHLCFHFTF